MIDFISQPWHWSISGLGIALVMLLLLLAGGNFGVSSTLRSICAIGGAGKHCDFFDFNWKNQIWNLVFVLGAVLGGYVASTYLSSGELSLSQQTIADLQTLGIQFDGGLVPQEIFSWQAVSTWRGFILLVVGGFLVGFGARYAGGCTSGHAISGLANFQLPSMIAVIGFFIGGLLATHFLYPLLF